MNPDHTPDTIVRISFEEPDGEGLGRVDLAERITERIHEALTEETSIDLHKITIAVFTDEYANDEDPEDESLTWYVEIDGLIHDEIYTVRTIIARLLTIINEDYFPSIDGEENDPKDRFWRGEVHEENNQWWMGEDAQEEESEEE